MLPDQAPHKVNQYFCIDESYVWNVNLGPTHSSSVVLVLTQSADMTMFSVCTYNIHNCYTDAGQPSFEQVVETIKENQPDILCLQVCIICVLFQIK